MAIIGTPHTPLQEINLGTHHLCVYKDLRIELVCMEQHLQSSEAPTLSLAGEETYRLLLALQSAFQQANSR